MNIIFSLSFLAGTHLRHLGNRPLTSGQPQWMMKSISRTVRSWNSPHKSLPQFCRSGTNFYHKHHRSYPGGYPSIFQLAPGIEWMKDISISPTDLSGSGRPPITCWRASAKHYEQRELISRDLNSRLCRSSPRCLSYGGSFVETVDDLDQLSKIGNNEIGIVGKAR
jgi:hypothetical protein